MKINRQRRQLLKMSGAAAAGVLVASDTIASESVETPRLRAAGYDYDRIQAIRGGKAGIENFDVEFNVSDIYKVNKLAMGGEQPFEITEIGLIPFVTAFINDDFRGYSLVPVFISRTFRHRNIYVHVDAGIEKPEDLRGRNIGTPGYGSSANTWIRGLLSDQYGVAASEMNWIEARKSSDTGTVEKSSGSGSRYQLADDFPLSQGPSGVDESELLLSRRCDALITPITPRAFEEGNPKIRQLFSDLKTAEKDYYRDVGMFPIMHAVAIRSDVAKAHPALPVAVLDMYGKAKQIAYKNLATTTVLRTTLPWVAEEYSETRRVMGDDYWPYGIKANIKELESVMRYTFEQGLVKKHVDYRELFHPSTLDS